MTFIKNVRGEDASYSGEAHGYFDATDFEIGLERVGVSQAAVSGACYLKVQSNKQH